MDVASLDAAREKAAAADRGESVAPLADPAPSDAAGAGAPGPVAPLPSENPQLWIDAAVEYGRVARELLPAAVRSDWTDERLQHFGAALARCAQHYGWRFGGLITHPLAGLAVAAWPLAWPIAKPFVMPQIERLYRGSRPAQTGDAAGGAGVTDQAAPPAARSFVNP